MKKLSLILLMTFVFVSVYSAKRFVSFDKEPSVFYIISDGTPLNILFDSGDKKGVDIAVDNLADDFKRVCGVKPQLLDAATDKSCIIIGSLESKYIKQLVKSKKLDKKELQGKNEKYIITTVENFFANKAPEGMEWKIIPDMGRTLGGVTLMPYTKPVDGASVSYKMTLPDEAKNLKEVKVIVVIKSTLAFADVKGHKYSVGFRGGNEETVNFNHNLNELPENVYTVYYPTVARRVIEKEVTLKLPASEDGTYILDFKPLHPAVVLEKIVIDCGGYEKSYLYMNESECKRN